MTSTQNTPASYVTAAAEEVVRATLAVELDFASGFARLNGCHKDIAFDSGSGVQTFSAVGQLGAVQAMKESIDLKAQGIAMQLSGVPGDKIALALDERYQGRTAKVWFCLFDADWTLIDAPAPNPLLLYRGRMDVMSLVPADNTWTIALTVESRLADWDRPRVRRFTNEDQQRRFPGDRFFEYVPQMVEKQIVWPAASFFS